MEIEKISEAEKHNIREMGKATTFGMISFLVFSGLGMGTMMAHINIKSPDLFMVLVMFVSIYAFIWFLITNYRKCYLFYLDKTLAKRIFVRDALYASIGYTIVFMSAFGFFGIDNLLESSVSFIGILLLYPTIRTDRKMGLRYNKVKGILGENFYLYFNCKEL